MRWIRLIIGELLLLFASILVFRSAWTMLDEYLGKSNLWLMLVLGIALTVVALILLDYEVKCELEKRSSKPNFEIHGALEPPPKSTLTLPALLARERMLKRNLSKPKPT
jgi:hypothetical protein